MKMKLSTKLISLLLAVIMLASIPLGTMYASAEEKTNGKYLKDVFVAYGETEDEANKWLKENGWEPVKGDLNAGNTSKATGYKNAVAVMGIKRTNNAEEAITDMATMNMKRDYSFDDYKNLIKEKGVDIDQFIKTFIPVLEEYRANYNGKGSEGGKKRAKFAHDLLNKFYDGDPEEDYAGNDTGLPLGDLLLNKTTTELGKEYSELSAEQKKTTGDLRQIIMESTGPAIMFVEQTLSVATDTRKTSWLDLLKTLTGTSLTKNVQLYVEEAKGKKLTTSQAKQYLNAHYQDPAKQLQSEWSDVHNNVLWFESYCKQNDLWRKEDETQEQYNERVTAYFDNLKKTDENRYNDEFNRYEDVGNYYTVLTDVTYSGAWGKTLYEFFADPKEKNPGNNVDNFLPLAAVLSPGQRAGIKFLSLSTLLKLGSTSDEVMKAQFPAVDDVFKVTDKDAISVYSGINRGIFREGVALTTKARMRKDMGDDPYDAWLADGGYGDIITYSLMGTGLVMLTVGAIMTVRANNAYKIALEAEKASSAAYDAWHAKIAVLEDNIKECESIRDWYKSWKYEYAKIEFERNSKLYASDFQRAAKELGIREDNLRKAQQAYDEAYELRPEIKTAKLSTAGRWMMGIGGAIMLLSAAAKVIEITQWYDRTFTRIPTMIVDEADIVSYTTDENGRQVKNIDFDQFAYYEVVKCNRQQNKIHQNAQKNVDKYKEWGCGDAADLNADVGKQWLALYVNRSSAKGNPILADKLLVQYGSSETPEGYNGNLHMFTFTNPVDVGDGAYCYRSDKNGTYLFWQSDEKAYTASTFNYGYLALVGIGGLAVGIVGTTVALYPKRKKNKANATA